MQTQNLHRIKNLVIDMGGVIIDIDYNLTARAFEKHGIKDFEHIFTQAKQLGFIDEFEKGTITPSLFRNELKKCANIQLSDDLIDTCWNALILDFTQEKLQLVQALSKQYNLFLLSNNNAIHFQKLISKIEQVVPFTDFSSLFLKNYYSHQLKMRKPDAEIFNYVLQQNNLLRDETLFIDDSIQHIQSAEKIGIPCLFVRSSSTLSDFFDMKKH
ncbi:MAG TPA: HAD family phosphatase [Bacteroidia bacterium]|nr:HAD family phosphatase [Bacteroidia bacterium]